MDEARVDELYQKWQTLRAQGRLVLPEWLCGDDAEMKKELDRRIELAEATQRRTLPEHAPFAVADPEDELVALLRQRLRWLGIIFMVWWLAWGVTFLIATDDLPYAATDVALHLFTFCSSALLTVLLWSPRPLSLRQLRGCELLMFGLLVVDIGWDHYRYLDSDWLIGLASPGQEDKLMDLYGDSMAMPWMLLMLVYAMYIPSEGRRCTVVVTAMAITPFVLTIPFLFGDTALAVSLRTYGLRDLFIWVGIAHMLAVWGSHKITAARQQAQEAREYGQYRLKGRLGQGGMGELFLAQHRLIHRPCVIKIIRAEKAKDNRALLRFEREVQTLANLTHWNVVQIYDYGTTSDGTFYYVMEFLPGHNLADLVARAGPLPAGRVVHLLRQACAALHEAHSSGLIHRDIKPQNIIVTERGLVFDVVKLLDFGLVRELVADPEDDRLTRDGALVGTPAYMSPEQVGGATELDGRCDLYSMGAVAYFLLTGRPPFERKNVQQVCKAHLLDPVIPPSSLVAGLPTDVEALVLRCLAKDPAARFGTAMELDAALAGCSAAADWNSAQAAAWWRDAMLRNDFAVASADA